MTAVGLILFVGALAVLSSRAAGAGLASAWARRAPEEGLHPWAELAPRAAAGVLGIGIGTALLAFVPSVPWTWLGGACACETYGGLHVCPVHPGPALGLLGPVLLAASAVLAPALRRFGRIALALRDVSRLTADARVADGVACLDHGGVPLVFATGLMRPRLFVDGRWWSQLDPRDRTVIEAHERAHLAAGDTRTRVWLDVVLSAFSPSVRERVMDDWTIVAELRADEAASRADGDPLFVADVLCRYARAGAPGLSLAFGRRALAARVHALLADTPRPRPTVGNAVLFAVTVAVLGAGHVLHRLLELGLSILT